jgi:Kdo2-lipid IVA lauroyltransferase/acyltransferase
MIQRAGLTGLLRLTAALPLPLAHGIGSTLGWLLWRIPNELRRIAARNLSLCFPEMGPAQRDRLLRRNLLETGKLLLELGPLWLWPGARVLGLVRDPVAGEGALSAAVRQHQGAILITPHLGAWEMAGLYYSSRYPLTILYRPSRLGLDELSLRGRGRLGGQVVATDSSGIRTLVAALRKGEALGILPDQDPGEEGGVFAPFFGIAASTMTLVSRLALKTGAPVFLTWAERLPRGRGFVVHLQKLPEVAGAASLEESVAALNRGVEAAIRALPAQYLWAYKRFKTRPPDAPKLY